MDFGIYIMTYPGDYHLAYALIKSIQYFCPETPIAILPGDGFKHEDHPFKQFPVLTFDEKKWELFTFMDRKFRLFEGPFKRFFYLDADIICTGWFDALATYLQDTEHTPGMFVNFPHKYYGYQFDSPYGDDRVVKIKAGQIGDLENIKKFDSQFSEEIYDQYPFNAGLFAAHRSAFHYEELLELKHRELEFFNTVLKKPYSCDSSSLFYVDQGRFNYMAWKKKLPLYSLYPHAHYIWGGKPFPFTLKQVLANECDIPFVHWAGCPRPSASLFSRAPLFYLYAKQWGFLGYKPGFSADVPAYQIWKHFAGSIKSKDVKDFTIRDLDTLKLKFKNKLFKV